MRVDYDASRKGRLPGKSPYDFEAAVRRAIIANDQLVWWALLGGYTFELGGQKRPAVERTQCDGDCEAVHDGKKVRKPRLPNHHRTASIGCQSASWGIRVDFDPRVSCVVLNWNGWKDTVECLDALKRSAYSCLQLIVVDNSSTDDSVVKI